MKMAVTVVNRHTGEPRSFFNGDLRVFKNTKGDKWFIMKDLTEEEMKIMRTDKEVVQNEYSVDDYYLILN